MKKVLSFMAFVLLVMAAGCMIIHAGYKEDFLKEIRELNTRMLAHELLRSL